MAVVPSAIAAYLVPMFVAFAASDIAFAQCAPHFVVSGDCKAPWYRQFDELLMFAGAVLAAFLLVLVPALVARNHRRGVASVIFVVGAIVSVALGLAGYFSAWPAPIVAGIVALLVVRRIEGRHDS